MSYVYDSSNGNDANSDDRTLGDTIPTNEIVGKLSDAGMPAEVIALTLGAPVAQIRSVLTLTRRIPSPAERQLTEDVRALASIAVKQAARIMRFGPTDQKMKIITSVLGHASRLIGSDEGGSSDEIRAQLEQLFVQSRAVPVSQTIVTEQEFVDISTLDGTIVEANIVQQPEPFVQPEPPIAQPNAPVPSPSPMQPPKPTIPPLPSPMSPMPANQQMSRSESVASLKALLESINNQDEGFGTAEVQY